jgi:hypothetical protein
MVVLDGGDVLNFSDRANGEVNPVPSGLNLSRSRIASTHVIGEQAADFTTRFEDAGYFARSGVGRGGRA